jgi:hypothetical protein
MPQIAPWQARCRAFFPFRPIRRRNNAQEFRQAEGYRVRSMLPKTAILINDKRRPLVGPTL